jgi:hypothetical protein
LGTEEPRRISEIVANPDSVWRILGGLAIEIRGAYAIVAADDVLSSRLEILCNEGPQPEEIEVDAGLFRAGLVKRRRRGLQWFTQVRASVFASLAS